MKREIKFRGKREDNNEWVYGDLHSRCFKPHIHIEYDFGSMSSLRFNIKEETIGQFTGLSDKNGKEIYEGDIVKAPLLDPIFGDIIKDAFCNAEIKFNKGSFVVSYYKNEHNIYLSDLYERIEVIGNIYDNYNLLEE